MEKESKDQMRQIRILEAEKGMIDSQVEALAAEKEELKSELEACKEKVKFKLSTNTKYDTEGGHKYSTPHVK